MQFANGMCKEAEVWPEDNGKMREWQQKESGLGPGAETQYINEWQPAHGYRGCGSWEVTRIAVENACVNEGLELSRGELDEGTNIW